MVMHDMAFGASIPNENLNRLHELANKDLSNINFGENCYNVNFIRKANESDISDLIFDLDNYNEIWGQENNEALIAVENIYINVKDIQVIGKNKDTLRFEKNGIIYIKFHAKNMIEEISKKDDICITIIGKGNINEWMGNFSPQIIINDYEISRADWAF